MALRAAATLMARSVRRTAPVQQVVRCLSGEYNPFIHSLDQIDTTKVSVYVVMRIGYLRNPCLDRGKVALLLPRERFSDYDLIHLLL